MKNATLVLCALPLAVACSTTAGQSDETLSTLALAHFETLKGLEGEWTTETAEGPAVFTYRVTAAGSAVEETMFRGAEHEMITMYHFDGDELMLKHYCAGGNQPTMRLTPESSATQASFLCSGGTNLASEDDDHMHEVTLDFSRVGGLRSTWTAREDGAVTHEASFELTRKR